MTEGLFEAEGKGEEGVAEGGSDGEAPPIKRPIRAGDRKSGQRRRKERERREEVNTLMEAPATMSHCR